MHKLWRLSLRGDANCGDCLRGVMQTAEIISAGWCKLRRLTPRSDAFRWNFEILCVLDSWEIWINWLPGIMLHTHPWDWLSGVRHRHTAEIDSLVGCTPWSFLTIQIKVSQWDQRKMQNYFMLFVKGAQMCSNHKRRCKKSRDTLPFIKANRKWITVIV